MNKSHALAKLLLVLHERRLRDAIGRFFLHRFHQNRKLELPRPPDPLPAWDHQEIRHVDAVIVQDLF